MAVGRPGARRQIAIAVMAGLALRLAFGLLYWVDKPLTHDEQEYLALAATIQAETAKWARVVKESGAKLD